MFDGHGVTPDITVEATPDITVETTPEYYIGGPDNVLSEAMKRLTAATRQR